MFPAAVDGGATLADVADVAAVAPLPAAAGLVEGVGLTEGAELAEGTRVVLTEGVGATGFDAGTDVAGCAGAGRLLGVVSLMGCAWSY